MINQALPDLNLNKTRICEFADDREHQAFVNPYIVLECVESCVAITCFVG